MNHRAPASIGMLAGATMLLSVAALLMHAHFQVLNEVEEYALPLAAEIPPLERRVSLLTQQMELSSLEASLRTGSLEEKLNVYVLPKGEDITRLLAFLESTRTFLENRDLLQSMSAIDVSEPADTDMRGRNGGALQARTIRFSAVLRPDGREQLLSILRLSGMLTVGDVLSPADIQTLFDLTEKQNYAGIVPVEQFLSADLLAYASDPTAPEARLQQAMSSEEFLSAFHSLLAGAKLPEVKQLLTGDLGRALSVQKLWPVQFMTIEKESIQIEDGPAASVGAAHSGEWETVELTMKAYSRKD